MKQPSVKIDTRDMVLNDKLVDIRRVAKVVKGGKRLSFSALVITGDGNGHVGVGLGKANEVPVAITKAGGSAKKNLIEVILAGPTIPMEVKAKFGAANVLLKPASPGTGVIAAGSIRAVLDAVGIKDILTKSLGSSNPINAAKATMKALSQLKNPQTEMARRKSGIKETAEKNAPGTAEAANNG